MKTNKSLKIWIFFIMGAMLFPNFQVCAENRSEADVLLFYGEGCPHCESEKVFFSKLEKTFDFNLHTFETWHNPDNAEILQKVALELGIEIRGVPFTIIGTDTFVGYSDLVGEKMTNSIKQCNQDGCDDSIYDLVMILKEKLGTEDVTSESLIISKDGEMFDRLKGKIVIKVEDAGKAYYINPITKYINYLGRPDDAFVVMREQGVGITNQNLEMIPIAISSFSGTDSDGDGLSDIFEDAIGTNKNLADSDYDRQNDLIEISSGYNPKGSGRSMTSKEFSESQAGKIFIQVEGNGEAWYVNPEDYKRYFLGRPEDAFNVMRNLGLGISNSNFEKL